jgi:hypothetical protein
VAVVETMIEVQTKDLREWDENPRYIAPARFDSLCTSIERDPEMLRARPLIALRDGRVIAGNMRLRAAKHLGYSYVPTVYVDMSEEEARLWSLKDNNQWGEWDDEGLALLLSQLEQAELPMQLTGFPDDDLARLLDALEPNGDDDSHLPTDRGTDLALADVSVGDPRHAVTYGETWSLGEHTLICCGVYEDWRYWAPLLKGDMLFVPYPTPTLPLTQRSATRPLLMVQPDTWLAGHVLDKYAAVRGEDAVRLEATLR